MHMTRYARARQHKQAIPPLIIDWLCEFGCRSAGTNGMTFIHFDKESRRSLCSEAGQIVIRRLEDMMDAYLVMSDERIISVGHHFKSLKHR